MTSTRRILAHSFSVCALAFAVTARADITPVGPTEVGSCSSGMYANCDSSPDQSELEAAGNSGAQDGNWDDLSGGVSSRPYVSRLAIVNGETETVLLSDGTPSSSLSTTPGSVGVLIAPINLCDSTETPAPNVCYSSPNRIQVNLVYRKSAGQVGYNFSFPNDGSLGTSTGDALPLKSFDGTSSVTVDQNTVVDLTLALNTLGQSLRWTWLNGVPTFWGLTNLGNPTATVRVKFKLAQLPALKWDSVPSEGNFCTAIPVSTCELSQSHSDWLAGSMILSLDQTLDESMTGALFATDGAIIGSVDTAEDSPSVSRLVYGLSSSHLDHTGAVRNAVLRAVIPASVLVQVLGIPSLNDPAAAPTQPSDVLAVERIGTTSSVTKTFERWTSADNGIDGVLMTVSGITFSAPQYRVKSPAGVPKVPKVTLASGKYSFSLSSASGNVAKTCKSKPCSVFVYRTSNDVLSSTLTKVTSKVATKTAKGFSASFSLKKNSTVKKFTKLLAVVKNKNKVLSSTPILLTK